MGFRLPALHYSRNAVAAVLGLAMATAIAWLTVTAFQIRERHRELSQLKVMLASRISEGAARDNYSVLSARAFTETSPLPRLLWTVENRIRDLELSETIRELEPLPEDSSDTFRVDRIRIRVSPVSAAQLYELMHALENGPEPVRISRFEISRIMESGDELDAVMQIERWIRIASRGGQTTGSR